VPSHTDRSRSLRDLVEIDCEFEAAVAVGGKDALASGELRPAERALVGARRWPCASTRWIEARQGGSYSAIEQPVRTRAAAQTPPFVAVNAARS